jgi:hypothetical protein
MSEGAPICRWIVKGCRVDIMPIDSRFGKQLGIERSGETGIDCYFIQSKVFRRNSADG